MSKQPAAITNDFATRLTIIQAAASSGVHPATIRRRIKDGTLPAVVVAGRYLVKPEDLSLLARAA